MPIGIMIYDDDRLSSSLSSKSNSGRCLKPPIIERHLAQWLRELYVVYRKNQEGYDTSLVKNNGLDIVTTSLVG